MPQRFDPRTDGPAVLFFSMDGCPWCTRAKPALDTVASTLGSVVPTYKVDASSPLTRSFGVSGFPTIVFVDGRGTAHTHKGPRTADAIVGFVCAKSQSQLSICSGRS